MLNSECHMTALDLLIYVQLHGLRGHVQNYLTLSYVTCGMELMHGDRMTGTKLIWT